MAQSENLKDGLVVGALAGVVGGLVFGTAIASLGLLLEFARVLGSNSGFVGFLVQFVLAAVGGAGFGVLVWRQRPGAGESLLWGTTYGLLWWVLGPLTLLPLLQSGVIAWDVHAAQENLPAMLGSVLYGASTGLSVALLRRDVRPTSAPPRGPLVRGALAGLLAAWVLGRLLNSQNELMAMNAMLPAMMDSHSPTLAWIITLLIGLVAGGLFAWLYPRPFDGAGATLMRGTVYGFIWWVVGAQTLVPLLSGDGLAWSLAAIQDDFATLPGYFLFGASLALLYQWLHKFVQLLFADDFGSPNQEGVGTEGLRALGRGAAAGLVGGLLFTFVMVQIGFLPSVASLVRSSSSLTGLIVHLIIANLIGMSYGVLFRLQSYDIGSALGWGVSYGIFWWFLGALTLMPVILGDVPQWTVSGASDAFPALVGHLVYGAGLGLTFYWLEQRSIPWWIPRSKVEAARIDHRREQISTSAPAVWVLMVTVALTLPVLLGM